MVKKFTSIFLSLSIVASLFAGLSFSAFAAPTSGTLVPNDAFGNSVYYRNKDLTSIATDATWDCVPSKSLIRGKTPQKAYYYVDESFKEDETSYINQGVGITYGELATDTVSDSASLLTQIDDFDNDTRLIGNGALFSGMFVAYGNGFASAPTALINDETKQYIQVNYELDAKATINSFFFGSNEMPNAKQPGHWKVYIADTEEGLFDEANCVAETDMVGGTAYRTIKTELGTAKAGKWVGLRIICAYRITPTWARSSVYPRIGHFSVQGTYVTPVASVNAADYTATVEGADATADAQVTSAELAGNTDKNDAYGAVSIGLSAKDSYIGEDGAPYQFKGWYNGEKKVADTAVATCIADAADSKTYVAKYGAPTYVVNFVGQNNADLGSQEVEHGGSATAPIPPTVSGYAFTGWDKEFSNVTENLTVTAQYFKPTHTSAIASITTDKKGNKIYARNKDLTSLTADSNWDVAPAKSLIRGKTPEKVYYYVNESFATDETSTLNGATDITFGELATDSVNSAIVDLTSTTDFNNDTRIFNSTRLQFGMFVAGGALVNDETKQYLQINFELDGIATIDSFIFGSDRSTASAYQTGHWKFYIADTEAGLFDEANCVAEMDMTAEVAYRTAKTVLATPKAGKWIGARIISAYRTVPASVYPRIDHFSVQGTYAEPVGSVEGVEVNVAKDAAVEAIDNIVVSKSEVDYGNSDRLGNYGAAKVAVTATKTAVKEDEVYAFAGWFNGETLVSSDAEFKYDLTNGSVNLVAKYVVYTLTSSKYEIKNGLVKIEKGDNASTVIAGFDQDANDIVIKNGETVLQGNDLVNGGMKVELTANGVLADSLDVVHRGDFDGQDGVTVTDIFAALDVMADGKEATEMETFRFDNGDGMLTVTDVVNARKAILEK